MSLETTSYVIKRKYGNQTRKLIMLCIADYTSDDTGTAWAYIDTLADRAECSRRSIQEHLDILERDGEVEIYRNAGPKGSHRYRIIFKKTEEQITPTGRGAEFAPRSDEQEERGADQRKGVQNLHGGAEFARGANQRKGVQISAKGCKSAPPICTQDYPIKNKRERESALAHIPSEFSEDTELDVFRFIAALRPGWGTALSAKERTAWAENLSALASLTSEERSTIHRFLHARLPPGNAYWQPKTRIQFLTDSSDVLAHALDWEGKQPKPTTHRQSQPIQTPEEKAQAEADVAEWLAAQKTAR